MAATSFDKDEFPADLFFYYFVFYKWNLLRIGARNKANLECLWTAMITALMLMEIECAI